MSAARTFLALLFDRAQAAQTRGASPQARLKLTAAQCPAYFDMRDLDEAKGFRGELELAQRKGAVVLELDRKQRPPRDVVAVTVQNLGVLGAHLGREVRTDLMAQASAAFASYLDTLPILDVLLERWSQGKSVRGEAASVQAITDVLDAVRVFQARSGAVEDVLMRRESQRLFGQTKRIEALWKWLDVLVAGDLSSSGLAVGEVLASLGLHHQPQPFLISAAGQAVIGETTTQLVRPFIGLPNTGVDQIVLNPTTRYILSVENRQTFHELAELTRGSYGCVLYTGGMPSPSWRCLYTCVLSTLTPGAITVYHFGDLDVGGFRIAQYIGELAKGQGHVLRPWLMEPEGLQALGHALEPATASQVKRMATSCKALGWHEIAEQIERLPGTLEQEALVPSLPNCMEFSSAQ